MRRSVLIISYSYLHRDPRVLRQIKCLGPEYKIITAGLSPSNSQYEKQFVNLKAFYDYENLNSYSAVHRAIIRMFYYLPLRIIRKMRNLILLRLLKSYHIFYWSTYRNCDFERLSKIDCDLIIANDFDTLPLAISLKEKNKCKVIFDSHEYSPLQYEQNQKWLKYQSPYITFLCKSHTRKADYCITVSYNIAAKLKQLTGVSFDVVFNAPEYQDLEPTLTNNEKIRIVHHGGASRQRKIESLIEVFQDIDSKYELHLILVRSVGDDNYYKELVDLSSSYKNIYFHAPVATEKICSYINQFDASLVIMPPVNFNNRYCLPNKFFESIQARLMIITGPSIEMEELTKKYSLGIVTDGFEVGDIRKSIEGIPTNDIQKFKRNCHEMSVELSSKKSLNLLYDNVQALLA